MGVGWGGVGCVCVEGREERGGEAAHSDHTIHCVNLPSSRTNTAWSCKKKQASALSVTIAHLWAESYRQLRSWSVFTISRCILPLRYGNCCHDPFIVRSAPASLSLTGFTQLAHPSRSSRSTLTTVCFCSLVFP